MDLRTATEDFLQFCTIERQLSHFTIQAYAADLNDFGKFLLLDTKLSTITSAQLSDYLKSLVVDRQLAGTSVRRRFACLRVFLRRAVKLGLCSDPFAGWDMKIARRKRLPRALSRPETSSLIRSLAQTRPHIACASDIETAINLIVSTGIRVGELCKLCTEDVSPDGSTIRIQGKGSRDRVAYISDRKLQSDLQRLAQRRRGQPTALFRNRYGAPMRPQSIRSKLRQQASTLGFSRRVTPHMLRHTAATLLIEEGVDIRFVQRLLGHSSIATTEIYTHVSDEALRARLQKANILGTFAGR